MNNKDDDTYGGLLKKGITKEQFKKRILDKPSKMTSVGKILASGGLAAVNAVLNTELPLDALKVVSDLSLDALKVISDLVTDVAKEKGIECVQWSLHQTESDSAEETLMWDATKKMLLMGISIATNLSIISAFTLPLGAGAMLLMYLHEKETEKKKNQNREIIDSMWEKYVAIREKTAARLVAREKVLSERTDKSSDALERKDNEIVGTMTIDGKKNQSFRLRHAMAAGWFVNVAQIKPPKNQFTLVDLSKIYSSCGKTILTYYEIGNMNISEKDKKVVGLVSSAIQSEEEEQKEEEIPTEGADVPLYVGGSTKFKAKKEK